MNPLQKLIGWMEMIYSTLDSNEEHNTSEMDAYENVISKAKQLQEESEWISVEDSRKPKDGERVLVYIDYLGGIQVTGYLFIGIWNLPNFIRSKIPTHWQPLPKSPSI
jgi:hypothetical protein